MNVYTHIEPHPLAAGFALLSLADRAGWLAELKRGV